MKVGRRPKPGAADASVPPSPKKDLGFGCSLEPSPDDAKARALNRIADLLGRFNTDQPRLLPQLQNTSSPNPRPTQMQYGAKILKYFCLIEKIARFFIARI
jgi:hypothetical protein